MTVGFYYLTVVLALAIMLPFRVRAGASLALADLVAFPAAACLLIEGLRSPRVRARMRELQRINPVVVAYMVWTLFTAVVGLARSSDVLKIEHDLLPGFTLYFLIGLTIDRPQRLRALVTACCVGVACHVVLGLIQFRFGGPFLTPTSPGLEGKLDVSGEIVTNNVVGLFPHPNGLALFLLSPVLVGIALLPALRARGRWILAIAVAVVLFVLVETQGKGALAYLCIGILLLAIPARFGRARVWLAIVLPLVAIVGILWYSVSRFVGGDAAFGTLITRLELWNHAIEIIRDDTFTKLVGNGYPLFGTTVVGTFEYPNAHNAWLNNVLSFGLPGLAMYLGCFAMGIRLALRKLPDATGPARAALAGCMASLAALFGEYFFEPADRGEIYAGQVFLLLAVIAVLSYMKNDANVRSG